MADNKEFLPSLPILPSLALLEIFKSLNFDTLKNCRLVSKTWNVESTNIFKNKSRFVTQLYAEEGRVYNELEENMKASVNCRDFFTNNLDMTNKMPIVHIDLQEIYATTIEDGLPQILVNWFEKNGSNIKSLRYPITDRSEEDGYRFLLKILSMLSQNLEELELYLISYEYPQQVHEDFSSLQLPKLRTMFLTDERIFKYTDLFTSFPNSSNRQWDFPIFSKLLEASPNLETIKVYSEYSNFSTVIAKAIYRECYPNLKHIFWSNTILEVDLYLLLHLRSEIKLETLDLNKCQLNSFKIIPVWIFELLNKHSDSLKTLEFDGSLVESWKEELYDDFPFEFEEVDPVRQQAEVMIQNLGLDFIPSNSPSCPFLTLKVPLLVNLTSLSITDIFHLRLEEGLLQFLSKFPVLKKLRLENVCYASDVHPLRPDQVLNNLFERSNSTDNNIMPHKILEEFWLEGELLKTKFIEQIADWFPNVKAMRLQLHSDEVFCSAIQEFSKKLKLTKLDLKIRNISNPKWCNDMLVNWLPKMTELKNLKLEFENNFPLFDNTVEKGICGAISLRWLELHCVSFCTIKIAKFLELLHSHCVSVIMPQCVLYTPNIEFAYDFWNSVATQSSIKDNND